MNRNLWSKKIISRDMACLFCGSNQALEAHHIFSRTHFPLLAFSMNNGVTLCHDCHLRAHKGSYNPKGSAINPKYTFAYCKPVIDFIEQLKKELNNGSKQEAAGVC